MDVMKNGMNSSVENCCILMSDNNSELLTFIVFHSEEIMYLYSKQCIVINFCKSLISKPGGVAHEANDHGQAGKLEGQYKDCSSLTKIYVPIQLSD